ncbi:MAG: VPS10 domain-containing protein [Thermoanaerobaculia bacterium]
MPRNRFPAFLALAILAGVTALPAAGAVDPDLLAGMQARSIGPAGMSGRVAAVDAVVSNPDVIWVGAATGGVWKSVDGGLAWRPVFDDQPVASIGAVAIDQSNPDVVWVGTGEGNVRNSVSVGNGVYRTLDGGRTWQHLGLEKSERIYRIVLHPSNPDVAWVSAMGQLWGENPERGVYKTEDGGKTWNRVLFVDEKTGASDLVIDPSNPNHLLASMWQFRRWPWFFKSGGPGSGLWSTYDGGRTWKKATEEDGLPAGELGRIGLGISRSNPEIVYALVEASPSALLRSDDGGKSWKSVNTRWDVAPRPFYFGDIRVDPVWPNRVYSLDYDVRVSNDSGKTFEVGVSGGEIHGDFHALWINPNNPDHLIVGGDGGLGISYDRGRTNRAVLNVPLGQFYHVAVDNEMPYNVYGGLQDNGSWRGPYSSWTFDGIRNYQWLAVGDGDGFETLPEVTDPQVGYSMSQGGYLGRYDLRTYELRGIRPPGPDGVKLRFNWNAGLATDPFTPGTIYYSSQFLHKSTDRGESWTIISPDLTTNDPEKQKQDESGGLTVDVTAAENHTTIIAIAPSALQQGVIWVGTDDGRLHVTRDGGQSWESVEKNVRGVPAGTWIPEIRPSKYDPASAFVAFDNHRRADFKTYVYRTDDWGKSWKSLSTDGVRGYAFNVEQDPVDKDLLFLGTEFGLWFSRDAGKRWTEWTQGLPTVSVMDMVIHPRDQDLVVATHGRAVYVIDDIRPLRELSDQVAAKPLHLFAIGDAQQHLSGPGAGGFALGATEFRGQSRPYGALLNVWLSDKTLPHPKEEKERERKEKERAEKREAEAREGAKPKGKQAVPGEERPAPTKAKVEQQEKGPEQGEAKKDEEDKKEKEKPKEIEVLIADSQGKHVRKFTAPARQGLNRVVWNLRRDAFKQFPFPPEMGGGEPNPSGPEVMPGTYQVTVRYGDQEAKGTVKVLPEPRRTTSAEDMRKREDAIQRTGDLQDSLVTALERIQRTRADVQSVTALLDKRKKDEEDKAKAEARAKGLPAPSKKDEKPDPLSEAAGKVQKGLTDLEKKIWLPPDTPGIPPEKDAASKVFNSRGNVLSSLDAPSATHLEYLRQAEAEVAKVLTEVNQFFAKDVADFRKQVDESGLRLLPPYEPIPVKGGAGS